MPHAIKWVSVCLVSLALVVACAGLTIVVISTLVPPRAEVVGAATLASVREGQVTRIISSALVVVFVLGCLANLLMPLESIPSWMRFGFQRRKSPSGGHALFVLIVFVAGMYFGGSAFVLAIQSIQAAPDRPLTDHLAFRGIGTGLGTTGFLMAMSVLVIGRWGMAAAQARPLAGAEVAAS